jgi:hypothetical protein
MANRSDAHGWRWGAEPHDLRDTPEARLFAAILAQAVLDLPREDEHGASARAYLDDPEIQELCEGVWGVHPTSEVDWDRAGPALTTYRQRLGALCRRDRRTRIVTSRAIGRRLACLAREEGWSVGAALAWLVEQEAYRRDGA